MKLRKSARVCKDTKISPGFNKGTTTLAQLENVEPTENSPYYDDHEEDVTFEEIHPFSPLYIAVENKDDEDESESSENNMSGDKDCVDPVVPKPSLKCVTSKARAHLPRKNSQKKELPNDREYNIDSRWNDSSGKKDSSHTKKRKTAAKIVKGKKQRKMSESSKSNEDDPGSDVELEHVIGENQIPEVKKVLDQLPEQFAKEYCIYLYDLINKDLPDSERKPPKRLKQYSAHAKSKENAPAFMCVICNNVFKSSRAVAEHLKTHGGPKGFSCICEKSYKTFKQFYDHVNGVHVGAIYKCPYCSKSCYGHSHLRVHWKKDHKLSHQFACALCDKGFQEKFKFLEHLNVHTGVSPLKCKNCDKAYRSLRSLEQHVEMTHIEKHFKCLVCNKFFGAQRLLSAHAVIHGDVRKFKCNLCEKSFKTQQNLKHHKAHHDPVKSYQCPDCSKCFTTRHTWRRHCQMHEPQQEEDCDDPKENASENSLKCDTCHRRFKLKSTLMKHCKVFKHGSHSEKKTNNGENVSNVIIAAEEETEDDSSSDSEVERTVDITDKEFGCSYIALNSQPLQLDKPFLAGEGEENDSDDSDETTERILSVL